MPRAGRRCLEDGCDNPAGPRGRCTSCEQARQQPRESRQQRGYTAEHDARATALRRHAERLQLPCSLCGGFIDYRLRSPHPRSFVAHHTTRDKRGPLAQAHRRCNEHAGQPDPGPPALPGAS